MQTEGNAQAGREHRPAGNNKDGCYGLDPADYRRSIRNCNGRSR